jgi:hypothetical protein
MKVGLPMWLPIAALLIAAVAARAQGVDPLPPETRIVSVSGAAAPTEETFTIATAQDLVATLTDLQTPGALSSASVVVTQGAAIVGMATMASPATTATVSLPGAVGVYTLRVIGTPNTTFNVGTFSVCVAPKSTPTACIQSASTSGNITLQSAPTDPTVSTAITTLTVTTGGSYTFTYADAQFPVALVPQSTGGTVNLALFQGSTLIAAPIPVSPATIALTPGTYTLFAVAQADPTVKAGLYGITISGPPGVAPLLNSGFPVGVLSPASQPSNPSAQTLTLKVTDFAFPTALASASAIATSGATTLGTAAVGVAGGTSSFMASAGPLQVWSYAAAGTGAGTYEVDLTAPSGSLLQTASGVNNGSSLAYGFVSPTPVVAGTFKATATDFEFPAALQGLQFAVAQNGAILQTASAAGTLSFTAAAGPVVLLVDATTPTSGNGMFDVNVATTATVPQIVFDQTQGVSATGVFTTQTINLGTSGNFDVILTDLQFPAKFQNLALVVSNDGAVLGKIYGGGTFTISASPGAYQLNFIAMPGANAAGVQQQYGLYGVQITNSLPVVTLTASPTTVVTGAATTLSWTTSYATSCTGSGGTFTGNQVTGSGMTSVSVTATTTYTLTCTGPGGSAMQSVVVTATTAPAKSGGGGEIDLILAGLLGMLALARIIKTKRPGSAVKAALMFNRQKMSSHQ